MLYCSKYFVYAKSFRPQNEPLQKRVVEPFLQRRNGIQGEDKKCA